MYKFQGLGCGYLCGVGGGVHFSAYHIFYLLEYRSKGMHKVIHEFHKYLSVCSIQKLKKLRPCTSRD